MKISTTELYRIILEEYIAEEGKTYPPHPAVDSLGGKASPSSEDVLKKLSAHLSENSPGDEAAEELLKKIMGDKYEPPEVRHPARYATKGGDTEPMQKPHASRKNAAETVPFDVTDPPDDATKSDEPEHHSEGTPEEQLMDLIQGMPPEEVAELFQSVFEKIPGVELSKPGEDAPQTLYSPGAEGRPQAGFKEEISELVYSRILEWGDRGSWGIRGIAGVTGKRDKDEDVNELGFADIKKAALDAFADAPWNMGDSPGKRDEDVDEGHYHDMGGDDEVYDVLDDEPGDTDMSEYYEMLETSPDKIPDDVLKDMMEIDGMEEMIVLDGEGGLANREEVIEALKDV